MTYWRVVRGVDRDPAQCERARKADRAEAHGLRSVGPRRIWISTMEGAVGVAARAMQRMGG